MATSGVRTFDPQFTDIMSEAFSRVAIRPANVTEEHIDEAIRSANLLLIEFGNRGVHDYQLVQTTIALVDGTATYNLPAGAIDVWHAVVRKDNQDTVVWPLSRDAYYSLPEKTNEGRPTSYFADRKAIGDTVRTITLWPVPDGTSATSLILWVWSFAETATKIAQTLSVSREWTDAYAAGLARRLARKYAPAKVADLAVEAGEAFLLAQTATRPRSSTRIRMSGYTR